MSKRSKISYILMFSFLICFMFIGYAALTDQLDISGSLDGESQKDVFIVDVTDETSNATLNGFYSTLLDQSITLQPGEIAEYKVSLYNNNQTNQFIYDGYTCASVPSGVEITVKEKVGDTEVLNCISSLIDSNGYDYFIVTYTNTTDSQQDVVTPIQFHYTKLEDQIKINLDYNGEIYSKYSDKDGEEYLPVTFDQLDIDLNNVTKNIVARCNNGGILSSLESSEIIDDIKYTYTNIKVNNITNPEGSIAVGDVALTVKIFDSLTVAVNNNEGVFLNDTSENNFLVLQNITSTVESTTDSMKVLEDRKYTINLNTKETIIHKPILNDGYLKVYDSNSTKGTLKVVDEDVDIIHNNLETSSLLVQNVNLSLETKVQTNNPKDASSNAIECNAIIVACDGLVEVKNCNLITDYGYAIYKRSFEAGTAFRNKTSKNSKVLLEDSTIESGYNNAIRLSDGAGYVSIVGSTVNGCLDYENRATSTDKMKDTIFACRHLEEEHTDFDIYYRYASTELKVYVTNSTIKLNNSWDVNHYYSDDDLNARIFYTHSAKFEFKSNGAGKVGICARTRNDKYGNTKSFLYPIAMVNGNGADATFLSNNPEHFLNKDGWYYIYQTVADLNTDTTGKYATQDSIASATYVQLEHFGDLIKVGDSFELINFNNPGELYVDMKKFDNTTSFFIPLTDIPENSTQGDYTGFDYEYTFLASSDRYYFNIARLGELTQVFHIENTNSSNIYNYTVGVKLVNTTVDGSSITIGGTTYPSVKRDVTEQKFTLMTYKHQDVQEVNPYAFVSKYQTELCYFTAADKYHSSTNTWECTKTDSQGDTLKFSDKFFAQDSIKSSLINTYSPNKYPYEQYLVSNRNYPNFKRNGWYLWQEDITIYSNTYTLNSSTLALNGTKDMGDGNTSIFVSGYSTIDENGVYLNCKEHNNSDIAFDDNYGYIRITSQREISGIEFVIKNISDSTAITNTPYLLLRTYSRAYDSNTSSYKYTREDYEIKETNVKTGIYRPLNINGEIIYDEDEDRVTGAPYYVEVKQTGEFMTIKVIFDAKYQSWNLHRITLDPFNDYLKDNTMYIKSLRLIHPPAN